MSCDDHDKMNPVVHALYHVKEWDKKMAKKLQDKFNLTDYQMLCLAFAKGFVIGAILLRVTSTNILKNNMIWQRIWKEKPNGQLKFYLTQTD